MAVTGKVTEVRKRTAGVSLLVENILIYVSSKELEQFVPGCQIQAAGNLENFSLPGNPGQFNEFSYYKSKNIDYIMWAESVEILSKAPPGSQWLYSLRRRLLQVYFALLPEKEAGTLAAMVLGEKAELPTRVKEVYQQAGLGHLLAISGLHISIAAMAVYRLILLLKGSKKMAAVGGMIALFFYGALTGFSISASRAVIMLLLTLLAELLGRTYDRETALGFSVIWILLGQPGQLFQSGFLLSFGAVLGAGTVYSVLASVYLKNERLSTKKKGSWEFRRGLYECVVWLKRAVLFQTAISLVTLPIILWFYYEIPVYGMVLNIFLVPLMAFITGGGLIAGFLGMLYLPLGRFFIGGVWFLLRLYEMVAEISLELSFSIWNPGQPEFWKLIFYGVGVFAVLFYLKKKENSKRSLVIMELGFLVIFLLLPKSVKGLEITFLDVGQGDGIFVSCEEGLNFMIDGGSSSEKEVGRYRLLPFIKYKGKGKLDYIFVSHLDEDHISGVRELLAEGRVTCLVLPADRRGSEAAEELAEFSKKYDTSVWWIKKGEGLQNGGFKLECLAPDEVYTGENENAASMVLLLEYEGFRGLFTGDLEKEGETAFLEAYESISLDCDFLKVAHHGSKNSTTEEFLKKIAPELAIISSGENFYGHPHAKTLGRLKNAGCKIVGTADYGAITVKIRRGKMKVNVFVDK